MMDDDTNTQISPYVREILRIVLDVKGRTLRKLNELVGQTSKFELILSYYNIHAKFITVQNYHVGIGEEKAPRPICFEYKHLRRSGRLAPTKRTNEKMQASTRTGRLV
jgi:hypothetical protein